MHCNDLDLDLPASRSEHIILRSAKLCEQLTDSNLSHPAVQNPHSTAQLCWLCRELGRAQTLKHGLGERCDRVRVECVARAGQAVPPNVFHPDHKACKLTEDDCPRLTEVTELWQDELRRRLRTWKELCKNEEEAIARAHRGDGPKQGYNLQLDDCSEDPEWATALVEARRKKLLSEWTRRVCCIRRCGGRCDRMYRDPWRWIRHRESQESCRMEIADDEVGDEESSDTD
jgi:hypothetical protein